MFLPQYQKKFLSNSKKIVVLLIVFLCVFQNRAYGETCDEKMSKEKAQFIAGIEAKFGSCKEDKDCIKEVKKMSKKRPYPYVKAFKECVNKQKDEVETSVEG
jgi:hypothetical protein